MDPETMDLTPDADERFRQNTRCQMAWELLLVLAGNRRMEPADNYVAWAFDLADEFLKMANHEG